MTSVTVASIAYIATQVSCSQPDYLPILIPFGKGAIRIERFSDILSHRPRNRFGVFLQPHYRPARGRERAGRGQGSAQMVEPVSQARVCSPLICSPPLPDRFFRLKSPMSAQSMKTRLSPRSRSAVDLLTQGCGIREWASLPQLVPPRSHLPMVVYSDRP